MADTATTDGLTTWKMTGGTRSIAFIDRTRITFGAYSNVLLGVHCGVVFGLDTKMSMAYKLDFPLDYDTTNILGKGVLSEAVHARTDLYFGKTTRAFNTMNALGSVYKMSQFKSMGEMSEEIEKNTPIHGMHRKVVSNFYTITSKAMKLKADSGIRFTSGGITNTPKLTKLDANTISNNVKKNLFHFLRTNDDSSVLIKNIEKFAKVDLTKLPI